MPPPTPSPDRSSKRPPQRRSADDDATAIVVPVPETRVVVGGGVGSVHASMTWDKFRQYLDGYREVRAEDLAEARGGRVRYVYERLDARTGRAVGAQYRLGGILTHVDPRLRYLKLLNAQARKSWSVQLEPTPERRTRLWYQEPPSAAEAAQVREILRALQAGELQRRGEASE